MRNQQSRACSRSLKKFMAKLRIEAKSRTPRLHVGHEGRGQELMSGGHNHRKRWKLDSQQKIQTNNTEGGGRWGKGRRAEGSERHWNGDYLSLCSSSSSAVHSYQAWLGNYHLSIYLWKIVARPNSSLYLRRAFWIKGFEGKASISLWGCFPLML